MLNLIISFRVFLLNKEWDRLAAKVEIHPKVLNFGIHGLVNLQVEDDRKSLCAVISIRE